MAGFKSTYQGVGFYESPGMWMSSRLDELWPQSPDKHNDSIYSDLAAWMQMDSVGNKFSQAKSSSINQVDPGKKTHPGQCLGAAEPPVLCGPHLGVVHPLRLVADWHAWPEVLFKRSALCYPTVILERNKGKKWTAFTAMGNLLSGSHPTLLFVIQRTLWYRAETCHRTGPCLSMINPRYQRARCEARCSRALHLHWDSFRESRWVLHAFK